MTDYQIYQSRNIVQAAEIIAVSQHPYPPPMGDGGMSIYVKDLNDDWVCIEKDRDFVIANPGIVAGWFYILDNGVEVFMSAEDFAAAYIKVASFTGYLQRL